MKRIAGLLLVTALFGPGCVSLDMNFFGPKTPSPAAVRVSETPPPPPPVTANQITEKNALEMMDALANELDYAVAEHQRMETAQASKKP